MKPLNKNLFKNYAVRNGLIIAGVLLVVILFMSLGDEPEKAAIKDEGLYITWGDGSLLFSKDGSLWETVDGRTLLSDGYSIRTGKASGAILQTSAGSTVRLGEDTEMNVAKTGGDRLLFTQNSGKTFHRVKSTEGVYEVGVLGHLIGGSDAVFDISVNKDAGRINVKVLDGEVKVEADLENDEDYKITKGKEMTIDPNAETAVVIASISSDYLASSWYSLNKDDSADDYDGTSEETEASEENNEDTSSATTKTTTTTTSTKTASATSTYSGGCKPYLSGRKDMKFNGILLSWSTCSNSDFQFYKVVRSNLTSTPSYPANPAIYSSPNLSSASYIDKTVAQATTYYYRVCAVQRINKYSCGNIVKVEY